jgi:diguanylate cyclase (GGDEF)-like protein
MGLRNRLPRWSIALLSLVLVLSVGVLEWASGTEITLSILYLIPVSIAAWNLGRTGGILFSAVASAAWMAADLGAGHEYSRAFIPFWNGGVRFGFFLVAVFSLDAIRRLLEHEAELARTDPLTGAANSRHFLESLSREAEKANRKGRPLALAYLDLDDFKAVNDRFGHKEGDRVLVTVSETGMRSLRSFDVFGRLGGDEFAILLIEPDPESVPAVFERLRSELLAAVNREGWPVSFSIGVEVFQPPIPCPDVMVHEVDTLMYEVKASSKNAVRFGPRMRANAPSRA